MIYFEKALCKIGYRHAIYNWQVYGKAAGVRRSRVLQSIQQKIIQNSYQVTQHALDEMRKDLLSTSDVKQAIRRCQIAQRFTRDRRGPRYRLTGPARDGREINVICRILDSKVLRIITVYATEEMQQ